MPALKGVDPKLAQIILDEILEGGTAVQWEDIAGQEVTNKIMIYFKYPLVTLKKLNEQYFVYF